MSARTAAAICASAVLASGTGTATAQTERQDRADETGRFSITVRSETYVELFRRALLPGPAGAIVATETAAPVHEYTYLRANDVDAPWCVDCVDVDVAAYGRLWLATDTPEPSTERFLDGDVQTASIRWHQGPISVRVGRQHAAGGAARFVRFDGVTVGAAFGPGLVLDAYGGFTVLPRWDERPGYHHLGAAADSLLRDPEALPEPERSGHLLAGGRFGYGSDRVSAGLSFNEQREPLGLMRRTLGVDGRAFVTRRVMLGGTGLMELDATRVQDARIWADATVVPPLDVSVEVLHTEPALFLSRQSVLAAFSTAAYEEAGGRAVFRATRRFAFEGGGWIELYDDGRRGSRGEAAVRMLPGAGERTVVRVAYGRVVTPGNGYHSIRASLTRRLSPMTAGTLEAYGYLYDDPIEGRTTSEVAAGTLSWQATRALGLMWGSSIARSPYAALDLQTALRLVVAFDQPERTVVR